jgi:predicted PurR-regulated permease PerM
MELDRDGARRVVIGLVALAILSVVGYVVLAFIGTVVFAIFLYYAVRPIFRFLDRFGLPRRLRAMLSLVIFGVPFLVLISYTVAIIAIEVQTFLEEQGVVSDLSARLSEALNVAELDLASLETLVTDSESLPPVDTIVDSLVSATSVAGSAFFQFVLIVAAVYYMLVDGPRLVEWFLDTYDESGVLREYVRVVDPELSQTLFGNIANIFITGIMAILTFWAYNLLVPATVEVPFPALAGMLVGVASLIPAVGIKLVYVPLTAGIATNAWLADDPGLFVPVAVFFVVSAVLLDFIPDIFVRAQFSGERTHTGLLMLSYIAGPTFFGFYGLFLAPILLIGAINATTVLLPYALSGRSPTHQATLSEFADTPSSPGTIQSADDSVTSDATRPELDHSGDGRDIGTTVEETDVSGHDD